MIKKILVPLDGSRLAEEVLGPVARMARDNNGTVVLLHAVPPAGYFSVPAEEYVRRERIQAARYLARVAERLAQGGGFGVQERVVTGEASRVIVAEAGRAEADLIALSTHGRTGIREWAFGSVAERVLRTTSRPVLVFRGKTKGPFSIRTILVALDGSAESLEVMEPAASAAAALQASMVLCHVGKHLPLNVQAAIRSLTRRRIPFKARLLHGDPAPTILAAARQTGADVIAMTTSGKNGAQRLRFGSVAEHLLKNTDRPLLVVRAG